MSNYDFWEFENLEKRVQKAGIYVGIISDAKLETTKTKRLCIKIIFTLKEGMTYECIVILASDIPPFKLSTIRNGLKITKEEAPLNADFREPENHRYEILNWCKKYLVGRKCLITLEDQEAKEGNNKKFFNLKEVKPYDGDFEPYDNGKVATPKEEEFVYDENGNVLF